MDIHYLVNDQLGHLPVARYEVCAQIDMIKIKCRALRKLYPAEPADEIGFMVVGYEAFSSEGLPENATSLRFKGKGTLLPYSKKSTITLEGDEWTFEKDGSLVLNVNNSREEIPNSISGVMSFLETLDGCDKETAVQIANKLPAEEPMTKLDSDPSQILQWVQNRFVAEKVLREFSIRRNKKEIFMYLCQKAPKSVSAEECCNASLAAFSLQEVQQNPFRFCIEGFLPYQMMRKIAKESGIDHQSPKGIQAAVVDVLRQSEGSASGRAFDQGSATGNTYCTVDELCVCVASQVGLLRTDHRVIDAINACIKEKFCMCAQGKYIYRKATCDAEYGIAENVARLMSYKPEQREYKDTIYALENKKHLRIAPEQRNAVKVALANAVTLLIGGPGTGKTTIEQFIIEVFEKFNPDKDILLVAPTGKAARRMSESCGRPACTVHKALNVSAGAEVLKSDVSITAGLILIDEASMLDAQVCFALFKAIQTGAQVVVVGDTNQLPSVGAGNVLYELIESKVVPIAELVTVYRQKAGSTIAVNCARIKRGNTDLEFSDTFMFQEVDTEEKAVEMVLKAYDTELAKGLTADEICLLSPYRRSTLTGVNQINPLLQKKFIAEGTPCIQYKDKTFYLGDKVMSMVNKDDVANGDTGYITKLTDNTFSVDFGDGRVHDYKKSSLRNFDLAYAITIHKSQGCEFKTCIIVLMEDHKAMLKKNLIYTAVSRCKQTLYWIGQPEAAKTAILTEEVSCRRSRLGDVLRELKLRKNFFTE